MTSALPSEVDVLTITGSVFEYDPVTNGQKPAVGKKLSISFPKEIKEVYIKSLKRTLTVDTYTGTVNADGTVSVPILDPTDVDIVPVNYTLTVVEGWGAGRTYEIQPSKASGLTFDIYDLRGLPSLTPSPGVVITKGDKGDTGSSAYDIWKTQGNSGTVSQFIASLKGATGDTGKSAYQIWLDAGNSGTQAQYLASLKGTTGDAGASAYQAWLAAGNSGTQAQFLASLKGATGDSAYAAWLAAGNSGDQAAFLASLKGVKGDVGSTGIVNVYHGTNPNVARPTGYPVVYWIGTVRPTNMQAQDWWLNS